MKRVWVLDTSTKGTGANVVPLESTLDKPGRAPKPISKATKTPARKRVKEHKPRVARRFKIVDLVSTETLAEGAAMKAALEVLEDVRSPVDVRIFVWNDGADAWRLLTLGEHRALWDAAQAARTSAR